MDTILSMTDFIAEQFNLATFAENVKHKTKVDITDYIDEDPDTGMILISIPMDDRNVTTDSVDKIEPLAKKYGKYYKGIHVDGDAKKIFIKFMSK